MNNPWEEGKVKAVEDKASGQNAIDVLRASPRWSRVAEVLVSQKVPYTVLRPSGEDHWLQEIVFFGTVEKTEAKNGHLAVFTQEEPDKWYEISMSNEAPRCWVREDGTISGDLIGRMFQQSANSYSSYGGWETIKGPNADIPKVDSSKTGIITKATAILFPSTARQVLYENYPRYPAYLDVAICHQVVVPGTNA